MLRYIYPTVRFGAVLKNKKPYGAVHCGFANRKCSCAVRCFHVSCGAVRCGFQNSGIIPCDSMPLSDVISPTLWFSAVMHPTARLGKIRCTKPLLYRLFNGAVYLRLGEPHLCDIIKRAT